MIGIDVVDVRRFTRVVVRSPRFVDRFFTAAERARSERTLDPTRHLAGVFAAKEAAMKALGTVPAVAYARRIEICHLPAGAPIARFGDQRVQVSISHDGGVAVAVAFAPAGRVNDDGPPTTSVRPEA